MLTENNVTQFVVIRSQIIVKLQPISRCNATMLIPIQLSGRGPTKTAYCDTIALPEHRILSGTVLGLFLDRIVFQ